jgi:hypothetical protein
MIFSMVSASTTVFVPAASLTETLPSAWIVMLRAAVTPEKSSVSVPSTP